MICCRTIKGEQSRQKGLNQPKLLFVTYGSPSLKNPFNLNFNSFSEIKPSPSHNIALLNFALDTLKLKRIQSLEHFALSEFELLLNVESPKMGNNGDETHLDHFRRVKSNRSVEVPLNAFWCNLTYSVGLNSC